VRSSRRVLFPSPIFNNSCKVFYFPLGEPSLELVDFFVGPLDQRPAAAPQTAEVHRLIIVEDAARHGTFLRWCKDAFAATASGGYIAVLIPLDDRGRIRRLTSFVMLPLRITRAMRAMRNSGATAAGLFGITPDLRSPTIISPLRGPAARYAQTNLLPMSASPLAVFREILARWAGCPVSVGAVLLVGRKP
jgi:hypothetical protein